MAFAATPRLLQGESVIVVSPAAELNREATKHRVGPHSELNPAEQNRDIPEEDRQALVIAAAAGAQRLKLGEEQYAEKLRQEALKERETKKRMVASLQKAASSEQIIDPSAPLQEVAGRNR